MSGEKLSSKLLSAGIVAGGTALAVIGVSELVDVALGDYSLYVDQGVQMYAALSGVMTGTVRLWDPSGEPDRKYTNNHS